MKDTAIRVLMVEDVVSGVELIEKELKKQNLNIVSSRVDTKEAFAKALQDFKPDVVLSAYTLPAFTGMEALRLSLLHDPLLPFIIVTESVNENLVVECMKAGSTDYVLKEHLIKLPFAITEALEKRKALIALHESEERYRSLFESNYEAMLLVDPKTAAIVDANYSACKYYGWSRREMLAKKITDVDAAHAALVYENMDLACKEAQNSFILRHRLADGAERNVGATMGPLFLKKRLLLYWTIHEIVERRPINEKIRYKKVRGL